MLGPSLPHGCGDDDSSRGTMNKDRNHVTTPPPGLSPVHKLSTIPGGQQPLGASPVPRGVISSSKPRDNLPTKGINEGGEDRLS
jgi:hypothetical protein